LFAFRSRREITLSAHRRVSVEQPAKQPVLIECDVRLRLMINAGNETSAAHKTIAVVETHYNIW